MSAVPRLCINVGKGTTGKAWGLLQAVLTSLAAGLSANPRPGLGSGVGRSEESRGVDRRCWFIVPNSKNHAASSGLSTSKT
jgi:hypothetical protein